ncbi:hypothetical protein M3J09_010345 [Ascochyta lentis]
MWIVRLITGVHLDSSGCSSTPPPEQYLALLHRADRDQTLALDRYGVTRKAAHGFSFSTDCDGLRPMTPLQLAALTMPLCDRFHCGPISPRHQFCYFCSLVFANKTRPGPFLLAI